MRHDWLAIGTTLGGLATVTLVVAYSASDLSKVLAHVSTLVNYRRAQMQQVVEVVTRQDGTQVTITTVRERSGDGTWEPIEQWKARHNEAVDAFRR